MNTNQNKTNMKHIRIRAMLLVLMSTITTSAFGFKVDGIYYNVTSDTDLTVEVTGEHGIFYVNYEGTYSGNVTIPSSVRYEGKTYRVTSIGDGAFCKSSQLLSVSIPESVTSMGREVFRECSNLVSVSLPSYITEIGNAVFQRCYSLTSIDIPNSVTTIGNFAFIL